MDKFKEHNGIVVPLDMSNIDTDVIIPKQFLQKITKEDFGKHLFYNWRFLNGCSKKINKNFILNNECYKNATILLVRDNFGCGSSREHAVWSLKDYGFKVIIAISFADIFYNNSFNNHLLLITLTESEINTIFSIVTQHIGIKCNINLLHNKLKIDNKEYTFFISEFHKFCLLHGLDSIDLTMKRKSDIEHYEKSIPSFFIRT
ncbi:MAG: 3-isopropylmalate dehydratase small subunit [Buchnera aphidicola (Eriosoma harunire)]